MGTALASADGNLTSSSEYRAFVDPRVNARQLEVLEWIADGCPPGRWAQYDISYKTSSAALASRDLVVLKGRSRNWSALVTDAGRHYLQHGRYPDCHRFATKPSATPAPESPARRNPIRAQNPFEDAL